MILFYLNVIRISKVDIGKRRKVNQLFLFIWFCINSDTWIATNSSKFLQTHSMTSETSDICKWFQSFSNFISLNLKLNALNLKLAQCYLQRKSCWWFFYLIKENVVNQLSISHVRIMGKRHCSFKISLFLRPLSNIQTFSH